MDNISRRRFLKTSGVGVMGIVTGMLTGCGSYLRDYSLLKSIDQSPVAFGRKQNRKTLDIERLHKGKEQIWKTLKKLVKLRDARVTTIPVDLINDIQASRVSYSEFIEELDASGIVALVNKRGPDLIANAPNFVELPNELRNQLEAGFRAAGFNDSDAQLQTLKGIEITLTMKEELIKAIQLKGFKSLLNQEDTASFLNDFASFGSDFMPESQTLCVVYETMCWTSCAFSSVTTGLVCGGAILEPSFVGEVACLSMIIYNFWTCKTVCTQVKLYTQCDFQVPWP